MLLLLFYFPHPSPKISCFFKGPWLLLLENDNRNQIETLTVLIATGVLMTPQPSQQTGLTTYVCVVIHEYTRIYNCFCTYLYLHMVMLSQA